MFVLQRCKDGCLLQRLFEERKDVFSLFLSYVVTWL
jgi:hypothetical protein